MKNSEELKPGDKVKIDVKAFDWKKSTLTKKFMDFVNSNADVIFTLKEYRNNGSTLWAFEEDDNWLFWGDDLIKV